MAFPFAYDVSEHNGRVDWRAFRGHGTRPALALCKTNQGDRPDRMWSAERVRQIRAAGLALGVWPFAAVKAHDVRSGAQEFALFDRFARAAGWGKPSDVMSFYDLESANGQPMARVAEAWLEFVEAHRGAYGFYPGIY